MRVLFVSHTAVESGAELSLLDLVAGLPDTVSARVACPEGAFAATLRARGVPVDVMPPVEASFRFHPVHTARGVAQVVRAAIAVRRAARDHRADLVHANSVRAGLAATLAAGRRSPPVLVHVRDCLPPGRAADWIRRILTRRATVVANSRYTAAAFAGSDGQAEVEVLHSPVDLERFDPGRVDRARARARLGANGAPVLAVVGQITPWKGQATAIEALAILRRSVPDASLLVIGSVKFAGAATRFDNAAYLRSLEDMAGELGLGDHVRFLGERSDLPDLLRAVDLVLVPSSEEPFGRVVVEAMAMETPVIATSVGGPGEVIEDGVTGTLVPPGAPAAWAQAATDLLADDKRRSAMGQRARRTALGFDRARHVERVLAVYRRLLVAPAR
jgi:glycosyltransferase involved in cell wall biosynthesis